MKKILALFIAAVLALSLASCGQDTNNTTSSEGSTDNMSTNVGAYTLAKSPEVTKEIKKLFKKASKKAGSVDYVPCAYIGSQVVAGTNHLALCRAVPKSSKEAVFYALVTVYEDLKGKAEITDIKYSRTSAPDEGGKNSTTSGGWGSINPPVLTDGVSAAFDKACETITGSELTPVAYIAMQVVGGFNYRLLCQVNSSVKELESEPRYSIVTVYETPDGEAEITDMDEFDVK